MTAPRYPGIRITTNGNQLVSYHTEARLTDAGIFFPITPSTEMGEMYQLSYAEGRLNVFGRSITATECEGEHAAQGGAIAYSVTGNRVVNFTSGQGIVYGIEQYYHAPGKLSTMVLEVAARALTKHALNVHCSHDDVYSALDVGWIMLFAKDAQQAADQALIIRKVTELSLTPGMNIQDGFLTSHLDRTFLKHEAELIREFLGAPEDMIDTPTPAQRELFGRKRRRVPIVIDLKNPVLIGPVQNQEHYMNGVVARRNNFVEPILGMLHQAYVEFGELTGRHYGFISQYRLDDAETVFVSLGSAAENIEAAVDHLRDTRGASVGSIHINVIRPFPSDAIVTALRGRKNVIILERTDEPLASDNPLARDIRTALTKALEAGRHPQNGAQRLLMDEMPRLFGGVYGLGSRDFRPEGVLGAYEFATGAAKRADGRTAADGTSFFVVGIDHPYEVKSEETPSLLPEGSIAVRLHSIGGWGMITTGKNLAGVMGELGDFVAKRDGHTDELGRPKEVVHISANPKYGSEKKGAPTNYFLVVGAERVRVNCDLRHVSVVLCCDPKAFTHSNPLEGLVERGVLVWESDETPEKAWQRIPVHHRKTIIDKAINLFILPGFDIARGATKREDLQLRMQGNAFLGAFFRVSTFLDDFKIEQDHFKEVVHDQYKKKFGRFGDAVVDSNLEVMVQGYARATAVPHGELEEADLSTMRGSPLLPIGGCGTCGTPMPGTQVERAPMQTMEKFDSEFRAGLGYHQPAGALSSVGIVAAATGATASKYVARRETPVFIAENCTQCMACIAACPDTALPNTASDIGAVLRTACANYVTDEAQRDLLLAELPGIEEGCRAAMVEGVTAKAAKPFTEVLAGQLESLSHVADAAKGEFLGIIKTVPLAYSQVNAIFKTREKKNPGQGGLFSIFVSDLCKGCAECVTECGDHEALVMVQDSEEINARITGATTFMDLLPETPASYLGKYDPDNPADARMGTLRNHLMQRRIYQALVSGDGACAGCGEKSALRAIVSVTEAYMRPLFHAKADRLVEKATRIEKHGPGLLKELAQVDPEGHARFIRTVAHVIMGAGGETEEDTDARLDALPAIRDAEAIAALVAVLRQEAFNHKGLQSVDGRLANGMSVMAMAAHTGCNTVFGSTPPNNPHPYPWMNSLFQDGVTVGWLFSISFLQDHARRSVVPERLADALTSRVNDVVTEGEYFDYCHFTDDLMTDREIAEMPKVWVVGGDGGMGDIGYQNVSKVVLQNRCNVKMLMLDTQVYSNTGGQNSDSSPGPGGFDMNQMGKATQGKMTEKKSCAETFTAGHGSPYVGQVSMANAARLYKSVIDALAYRGTAFLQCFTSCQPEHGVPDDASSLQAKRIRDARGMPEFVFDPSSGETYAECFDLQGNPSPRADWWEATYASTKDKYAYTVAHWAATEARFRRHFKKVQETTDLVPLTHLLICIKQDDVVNRRILCEDHRAFIPDFGAFITVETDGRITHLALSRQMVIFCVERRKSWRMLQSKAGLENGDYLRQRELLSKLDSGDLSRDEVLEHGLAAAAVLKEKAQEG